MKIIMLMFMLSLALAQEYLPKEGNVPFCDAYTDGIARSGDSDFWRYGTKGWKNIISSYPVRPNSITKITFFQVIGNYFMIGCGKLPDLSYMSSRYIGQFANSLGFHTISGFKYNNGLLPTAYSSATAAGDKITMTIDLRPFKKTVSFAKNGLSLGIALGGLNFWGDDIYIMVGIFMPGHRIKVIDYQVE